MTDPEEIHLQVLVDLEARAVAEYGEADAAVLLRNLPLDFNLRVQTLRRLLGDLDQPKAAANE